MSAAVEQHGHDVSMSAKHRPVKRCAPESVSETHQAGVRVEQYPDGVGVAAFGGEVNRMIGGLGKDQWEGNACRLAKHHPS